MRRVTGSATVAARASLRDVVRDACYSRQLVSRPRGQSSSTPPRLQPRSLQLPDTSAWARAAPPPTPAARLASFGQTGLRDHPRLGPLAAGHKRDQAPLRNIPKRSARPRHARPARSAAPSPPGPLSERDGAPPGKVRARQDCPTGPQTIATDKELSRAAWPILQAHSGYLYGFAVPTCSTYRNRSVRPPCLSVARRPCS